MSAKIKILKKAPIIDASMGLVTTQSQIVVKYDDFAHVSDHDQKTIEGLYDQAKLLYTHFIVRLRSLRRAREVASKLLTDNHVDEIVLAGVKFTKIRTISSVSKESLISVMSLVLEKDEERDDFLEIMNDKFKSTQRFFEYDYPVGLKTINATEEKKLFVSGITNDPEDVLSAYVRTALNASAGASQYLILMTRLREILRSCVETSKKTVRVGVSDGFICCRKNMKIVLRLSFDQLHTLISLFCEHHPYEISILENAVIMALIKEKVVQSRFKICSSVDGDEDDN
jgi:hypothetical protein